MRPARQPLRGAALKAAVAAREARAQADADERSAAAIALDVQARALRPAQGWWRKRQKTKSNEQVLRYDAVMAAFAVGCSIGQISRASGASRATVTHTISRAREKPQYVRLDDRFGGDWGAALADAAAHGLSVADVAAAQSCTCDWVLEQVHRHGFALAHRHRRRSLILPRPVVSSTGVSR